MRLRESAEAMQNVLKKKIPTLTENEIKELSAIEQAIYKMLLNSDENAR